MGKIDKMTLFLYSFYALSRTSNSNYVRIFDIMFFVEYLRNIYNEFNLSPLTEEEIINFTKGNNICHSSCDCKDKVLISCDKEKLREYIKNVTDVFLIDVCNKAEAFWWNQGFCDNCQNLIQKPHIHKFGYCGIDLDLYCNKYNAVLKESILPDEIKMILRHKSCIKDNKEA